MGQVKQYNREYKEEAIKLVEEKGCKKERMKFIALKTNDGTEGFRPVLTVNSEFFIPNK